MSHVARRILASLTLAIAILGPASFEARQGPDAAIPAQSRPANQPGIPAAARSGGSLPFVRTELFFGTARRGGAVTEEEFQSFIDAEVTPRFPEGLTLFKANGRSRRVGDAIVKEQSFVLVLLYPYDTRERGSHKIQRIRDLYKAQFDQHSVLRVDDPFVAWASF